MIVLLLSKVILYILSKINIFSLYVRFFTNFFTPKPSRPKSGQALKGALKLPVFLAPLQSFVEEREDCG
jgi:hypothetical protein